MRQSLCVIAALCCLFLSATAVAQSSSLQVPKKTKPVATAPKQKEKTPADSQVPRGYVDLGLPSGTYWKTVNEAGVYTYDEAVSRFGAKLPSLSQWEELKDYCTWSRIGTGYKVVGSNGNILVLPAVSYRRCDGSAYSVGAGGFYWTSMLSGSVAALELDFVSDGVYMFTDDRCDGHSVRLVQD